MKRSRYQFNIIMNKEEFDILNVLIRFFDGIP